MNKFSKILTMLAVTALISASAANLIFSTTNLQLPTLPRGTSQTAVLTVMNASGGITTNTLTVTQDVIYDSVGGTNLVWLRPTSGTMILGANGLTNLTFTVTTAGWTSTNQSASASLAITNSAGSYTIPLIQNAKGLYSPVQTNIWLNLDGTTNTVIIQQQSQGAPILDWKQQNSTLK